MEVAAQGPSKQGEVLKQVLHQKEYSLLTQPELTKQIHKLHHYLALMQVIVMVFKALSTSRDLLIY